MRISFSIIFLLIISISAYCQDVEIKLGSNDIALNEAFTITITVKNSRLQNYEGFPQIPGFAQRGTNRATNVSLVNGRRSSSESVTMNYGASKEGTFKLKPFAMTVNGAKISSPGTTIKVGPKKQGRRGGNNPFGSDPFDDFFGRSNQPQEFVDVKADAFLALTSNKPEIYRGEGVTITLAFYVSNRNRADMRFHELGKQINEIVKKIKPANCWEENFNIDNITGEPVTLGDKQYTQYKIYQAAYFPLNDEDLEFPAIPLEMIKYKVAKNPSFFGRNKQEDFQTFYTKPKTVTVKELPEHPLRESVSVGNFKLRETIDKTTLKTGESFNLNFDIGGRGNISGINPPVAPVTESLEIYDPAVKQNVKKGKG
ncbi:MAG: BatD family protein [Bacteroidota bacterium]